MDGGVVALRSSTGSSTGKELAPVRASLLPFEQLPNLPKPLIPEIDLGIRREDVLAIEPMAPSSYRRIGYSLTDRSSQTERSDILELKSVNSSIGILLQDVAKLRKDLNFAQSVMKADYESRLNDRATALYCHANERLTDLERQHQENVEIVRKSYRAQLSNAICKIAGEYKAYYDELLQGKTGRHDIKIKELKHKVEIQELKLEESGQTIAELTERLKQYEADLERKESEIPPPPPPGISMEEAIELQENIERLEGELVELRAELAAKEDANNQLSHQVGGLSRQLEDEKGKTAKLKRDLDNFRKKAKADQERTARMAENQIAALQKEMKDKVENAEKEAARRASEEAALQRMRDQARFKEEMDKRKSMEDDLRKQAELAQQAGEAIPEGDLAQQLDRLQKIEQRQRQEIDRLIKELDRTNRVWELKLAVMQRNFHALRDECYIRHSLQRQSAALHHATVGYAVNAHSKSTSKSNYQRSLKPLPKIRSTSQQTGSSNEPTRTGTSADDVPPPPSPTPLHVAAARRGTDSAPQSCPRSVHFDERPSIDSSSNTQHAHGLQMSSSSLPRVQSPLAITHVHMQT